MKELAHCLGSQRVLGGTAALTVAAAVAAVLAVREAAVRVLRPDPAFTPLALGSPVVATIGCTNDGYLRFCRNGVLSEPYPHMASSCGCTPDPFVCALYTIGDFTHYGRRLARGLRPHDDAHRRLGDLRNAPTLGRDHETGAQSPSAGPPSLDSLAEETSFVADQAVNQRLGAASCFCQTRLTL